MTSREILLSVSVLISLIFACVCLFLYLKKRHDVLKLTKSIDDFIKNGDLTHFSAKDGDFARLQNAVSDLENLYKYEKQKSVLNMRKTDNFIADISHQLKTPLAGLRLYVEIEHENNPTEHTLKELQLIEKTENLIFKLLKLEKIKNDVYTMNFKLCDVKDIVDETISEFRHLYKYKNYTVNGNATMRCDKTWLCEAIGNVVKNASEHTAEDGLIEIDIFDGDKSTLISVKDNGCGVSEKELGTLFERFSVTENSAPAGCGIGLAITKAIVEKHHGTVFAENTGSGFKVSMCFPRTDCCETF